MSIGNKVLVYRWFEEVWNKKNESVIDELLCADVVLYGLSSTSAQPLRGPAEVKEHWRRMVSAFPDIHVIVEAALAEDDKVAVRCGVRGTHTGDGLGFLATGKKVQFTGTAIATLRNGRFSEAGTTSIF